jgi:hypothetical protein
MAVNVSGGNGLFFNSGIELDQLEADAKKAGSLIESIPKKGAQSFEQGQQKANSFFSSITTGLLSVAAAQKAFDFLGDSINEALDAEQSTARFRNTLESINRADAFDRLMESADKLAAKFTYLDNDEVVGVFNKLVTYGKLTEKQMNDLLPVIINFSAKQRISIEQGSSIIIKALEGNTRSLKEYGINMKSTASETERLETIMTQLKGKVEGAGAAFQNTVTGGVASARQEFKNLEEDIGTGLLPILNKALSFINKAIKGLRGISSSQESQQSTQDSEVRAVVQAKLVKVRQQIDAKIINEKTGKPITAEDYVKSLQDAILQEKDAFSKRVWEGMLVQLNPDKLGLGGVEEETKKVSKASGELNSLLRERETILDSIRDIQRDSVKTGLTDEKKEVDTVSEKYDNLISKIDDYNKKAAKFGRPAISTEEVKVAKQTAIDNTELKQQANDYKSFLNQQSQLFQQFENAKKEVGVTKAKEMFNEQTKDYESYLDFLQKEAEKIAPKISSKTANIGDLLKFKDLMKAISDETNKHNEQQIKDFADLLVQTSDYSDKRQAIDLKYQKFFKTLSENRVKLGEDEYERRLKSLQSSQEDEQKALKESFARQSELYKKLGEDTLLFTKKQLKDRIAEFKKTLDTDTSLTPQMKADIQAAISNLEGLMESTDETIVHLNKFIASGTKIKAALDDLGSALDPLNTDIGDAIKLMSNLLGATIGVANGIKDFKVAQGKDDLIGQITSVTSIVGAVTAAIGFVVNIFKKAREERLKALKEVEDFYTQVKQGELEITAEYRQRQLEQAKLNKLKLDGLEAEKKALLSNKKEVSDQYNDLLQQLQQQSAVINETTKKTGGFLGIGRKTKVVEITQSLAGMNFDQLNELFTKGELTGKAKELFEQLQKLKQEGVDIDQQLIDLKERAAETFTGTTADSIVDSIAAGFKDGLHSAADFSGKFEDLMRDAIINSLKYRFLEGPIQDLFDEFAADSQSGGALTKDEIKDLQTKYNAIINNANKQFQDLQNIAGINFSATGGTQQQNTLIGNVKALTEDTGNELLGAFNGQRVATLNLVDIQKTALGHLNIIENNTATTFQEIRLMHAKMEYYFRVEGVKLK